MYQTAMIPELEQEFHRLDSVQRNRNTLKYFVEFVKNSRPGETGYVYTVVNRSKAHAEKQYAEAIERLKRACKRADVTYDKVCQENNLQLH